MTMLTLDLLQRSRVTLLWWLIGMLTMTAYVVGVYDSLGAVEDIQGIYDQYPESLRELLGAADISTIDGWIHIELLSWLPLVLAIYGGIFAATNVSREAEQRTLDFTLGLPVSRTVIPRFAVGGRAREHACPNRVDLARRDPGGRPRRSLALGG